MKIYVITREPFPNGMAATKRIICYAKGWISQGLDCEVLIYTRTEVYGKKPNNTLGHGLVDSVVPFRYMKDTPLRESNILVRKVNDYMDYRRLKKYLYANIKPNDLVFAYNGFDMSSLEILQLAHSRGAYYAQEVCELPFATSEETSLTIKKRLQFEKDFLPLLDGMITISDALIEYVKKYCSGKCIVMKIPILVSYEEYSQKDRSNSVYPPYIFHSGTLLQQKDGFLDMLKAFGIASKKLPFEVKFISTGKVEGSWHETEIRKIMKEYDIEDKVIFTGFLSNEELRDKLSYAAFVVINKLTTQQNKYCFSTKLGEYMAASKAIIITDVGESANWLTHEVDSYIIAPDNVELLAQAMINLFQNKELRKRIGNGAKETCEKSFTIRNNAVVLRDFATKIGLKKQ